MANIQDVAKSLGLSARAVYRRLDAFNGKLDRYLSRGPNNEILFNSSALALLRRLEDVRKAESIPIRQAVARVSAEQGAHAAHTAREGEENPLLEQVLKDKERLIEEKDWRIRNLEGERNHWRDLALDYHRQLAPPKEEPQGYDSWFTRVFRHIRAIIG